MYVPKWALRIVVWLPCRRAQESHISSLAQCLSQTFAKREAHALPPRKETALAGAASNNTQTHIDILREYRFQKSRVMGIYKISLFVVSANARSGNNFRPFMKFIETTRKWLRNELVSASRKLFPLRVCNRGNIVVSWKLCIIDELE